MRNIYVYYTIYTQSSSMNLLVLQSHSITFMLIRFQSVTHSLRVSVDSNGCNIFIFFLFLNKKSCLPIFFIEYRMYVLVFFYNYNGIPNVVFVNQGVIVVYYGRLSFPCLHVFLVAYLLVCFV